MYLAYPTVKKTKELDLSLVKNTKPCLLEKIFGWISIVNFCMMVFYKLYTGRGVFLNNPCHVVLFVQGYLLLTEKTKNNAILYLCFTKWVFCPWFAIVFPSLEGMNLFLELETFYIEHYLGAFI
jgi:hypothetical protein